MRYALCVTREAILHGYTRCISYESHFLISHCFGVNRYALRVKRSPMGTLVANHMNLIFSYLIVLGVTRYALRVTREAIPHGCTHCKSYESHFLMSHCFGVTRYPLRVKRSSMGTLVANHMNLIFSCLIVLGVTRYALRVKRSSMGTLVAYHMNLIFSYLIVLGVTRYALRVKRSPMGTRVAYHISLIFSYLIVFQPHFLISHCFGGYPLPVTRYAIPHGYTRCISYKSHFLISHCFPVSFSHISMFWGLPVTRYA